MYLIKFEKIPGQGLTSSSHVYLSLTNNSVQNNAKHRIKNKKNQTENIYLDNWPRTVIPLVFLYNQMPEINDLYFHSHTYV